jgi:hypothetical protein
MQIAFRSSVVASFAFTLLTSVGYAQMANFSDGFEGQALDPYWFGFANQGSITFPSVAETHSGFQSVQFNSIANASSLVGLQHGFASAGYGEVSVWVYDTGADLPLYQSLVLTLRNGGATVASMGALAKDAGPNAGGNYFYSVGFGGDIGRINYFPNDRTPAWHQFSIRSQPGTLLMGVDGRYHISYAASRPFDSFEMYMSGGPLPADAVSYWDDFSFKLTPVPEPSALTFLVLAIGTGIGGYVLRKRSNRIDHDAAS